uniref:Uncharacterized protein n=1 Tax=Panagrellus redivivus TaxID=6233 RepID=A0A7E4UVM8_PANRE
MSTPEALTTERTPVKTDAPSSGIAWWHIVIIVLVVCCVISLLVIAVIIIYCKHRNRPITVIQPVPSSSSNNKRRKRTASQKVVVLRQERPRTSEPHASARQQSHKAHRKEVINVLPPSESNNMPPLSETVAAPPLMSVEPAELSREKVTGTSKVQKRRQEVSSNAGPGRCEVERDNTADDKESEAIKNDEPPYFPATKIPSQRQLSESNEI